jgi:hypothetical protein
MMAKIKNTMTVSLEEFGKKAGEYALDEFEYKGLTIRQWADKITAGEYRLIKRCEWIYQGRCDEEGRNIYCCSECNFEVRVFPYNFISWRTYEKYCPHCGSEMRGDSE